MEQRNDWTLTIKPRDKWYQLNLKEVWAYRDLLLLFVRRDFVQVYKQTILGPIWFVLQPLLATTVFTIVLGIMAKVDTDDTPPFLFYLAGVTFWNLFAECLTKNAATFTQNSSVFGKVYFPRLIVPLGVTVLNYIKFFIQFAVFLGIAIYYDITTESFNPNWHLAPVGLLLLFIMGMMGFSFGVMVSSLTTKYRDFQHLVGFGTRMLMYLSSVVIPVSMFGDYVDLAYYNPIVPLVEAFKHIFLGTDIPIRWGMVGYSSVFTLVIMFLAVVSFRKVEKSFMDTV